VDVFFKPDLLNPMVLCELPPLHSPLCSSLISKFLLPLQNLLVALGMIRKSVYYTALLKTNLNLAGLWAGAVWGSPGFLWEGTSSLSRAVRRGLG
jgi:hypothetical protein